MSFSRIIADVAEASELRPDDLLGNGRSKNLAMPRHVAMYLLHKENNASVREIARRFRKTTSAVAYALEKVGDADEQSPHALLMRRITKLRRQPGRSLSDEDLIALADHVAERLVKRFIVMCYEQGFRLVREGEAAK